MKGRGSSFSSYTYILAIRMGEVRSYWHLMTAWSHICSPSFVGGMPMEAEEVYEMSSARCSEVWRLESMLTMFVVESSN
jgi:hypothetical protein